MPLRGLLERSWGHPGGIWGLLGGLLGASWELLGSLQGLLWAPWGLLGDSGDHLGGKGSKCQFVSPLLGHS